MSRSIIELEMRLSEHRAWRVKEISSVKKLAELKDRSVVEKEFFCRAGAALFYAHWEGFVKRACEEYLKYISYQKLEFDQMADFVATNIVYSKIKNGNIREASESIVKLIFDDIKSKPYLDPKNLIDTESNLSSRVFTKTMKVVGIPISGFETKLKAIDSILGSRNPIAHGAKGDVDVQRLAEIGDLVIGLTGSLKDEIENAAQSKIYRRAT